MTVTLETPSGERHTVRLRRVVLERLIRYYRYLTELTTRRPSEKTITSGQLGEALDVDPSQVRKDFGAVGLAGVSRVGYDICEVCRTIRDVLGFNRTYAAVLVGAGHLGSALLAYGGFERYGFRFVAAFDADPAKVGTEVGGYTIQPIAQLRPFVERADIPVAVLATPVEASQRLADMLVKAGVQALWNFTPTRLTVPEGVLTRNEHISVGLAQIAYHLRDRVGNGGPDATGEEADNNCCR